MTSYDADCCILYIQTVVYTGERDFVVAAQPKLDKLGQLDPLSRSLDRPSTDVMNIYTPAVQASL